MVSISQIFGPTIQGEGSACGRPCLFVRTFDCNLQCTWCDTAYTWAYTPERAKALRVPQLYSRLEPRYGMKEMSPDAIIDKLSTLWDIELVPTIIVISGGEPMMQQGGLLPLVRTLKLWGNQVHIETAGTIAPITEFDQYIAQYSVSPKLANSGNVLTKRYKRHVLSSFRDTGKAWFKFVVTGAPAEFDEIDQIVADCAIPSNHVMVMPEGSTATKNVAIAQHVIDSALVRGYGLTFRTHVLLWGNDPDK
jgi:7-carboxy-7-deazaguanine synthase